MIGANHAVGILACHIIREHEAENGWAVHGQDPVRLVLNHRVVIDGDVARAAEQHQEIAVPAPVPAVDVGEEVVADRDRSRLLARMHVVEPENRQARGAVPYDVVLERDLCDLAPGAAAVLVPDREENGKAGLSRLPVVVERVVVNRHAARVFQFEQVLHGPVLGAPRGLLRDRVAGDRDIAGH